MREIREYNMNGTIILGVDNGYGNVKTAHRVFPTGIVKCDSEPVLSKEYIEYDGAYYIIGEGHKGFVADKQEDDDTYILTLAAIAKELEARGLTEARIHLAVGLPLKWVQTQRDSFKQYLTRERYVSLKYGKVNYLIEIVDCTVMPQGYAAVAENLKDFKGMNLLVDVGNGTMNVMYLNNGRPIESKSYLLSQVTSYCINEDNRNFKSEYVISQLITLACKSNNIDGISYISKRVSTNEFGHNVCMNLALFIPYEQDVKYSQNMISEMKIGIPINYAYFNKLKRAPLNLSIELLPYELKQDAIAIGDFENQIPYRETHFYDYDRYLRQITIKKYGKGDSK